MAEVVKWKKKVLIGRTEYKYVRKFLYDGEPMFCANIPKLRWTKVCKNIRDAAKAVDLKMIEQGKEPINILVRK